MKLLHIQNNDLGHFASQSTTKEEELLRGPFSTLDHQSIWLGMKKCMGLLWLREAGRRGHTSAWIGALVCQRAPKMERGPRTAWLTRNEMGTIPDTLGSHPCDRCKLQLQAAWKRQLRATVGKHWVFPHCLARTNYHSMKYSLSLNAWHRNSFKNSILCYTLYQFMLKHLSTCLMTAFAGIYSNLFHFVVCFVPVFTDKFLLAVCTIKEFIQIWILQFAFALPLFTKIPYRYVLFFF